MRRTPRAPEEQSSGGQRQHEDAIPCVNLARNQLTVRRLLLQPAHECHLSGREKCAVALVREERCRDNELCMTGR